MTRKEHGIVPGPRNVHISTYPLKVYSKFKDKTKEGKVADCIADVSKKGTADDPGAVCAAQHDKSTGTTMWRGKRKSECQSSTSQVSQLRGKKKESFQFKESNNSPFKNHTFRTILIKEGMGNFKDRFFYTKTALKNASESKLFEGLQCFADHPNEIEEQIQPERSTRDILGYYENVAYEESEDGTGTLTADLCVGNSMSLDWAMSLLTNSIDYSTKFRESDLVGLSINASGSAIPIDIDTFMKDQELSVSVIQKLNEAKTEGITEINVVNELTQALSVDLVTKAGAGGKILKMLEMEKNMGKKKSKFFEAEMEKHKEDGDKDAHAMAPGSAGTPDHDDEAQDKALFSKMIKQYLGKDDPDAEEMEMAQHAYQAHKENGMEQGEAYEAAGKHLKMAMEIGKKMAQAHQAESEGETEKHHEGEGESEAHEESATPPPHPSQTKGTPSPTGEGKKESMVIKLSGEVAKLRESLKAYEMRDYLDKKLRESGRSNSFTKKFREALGVPKSKEQIDQMWKIFLKAADAGVEEVGSESDVFVTEKSTYRESENRGGSFDFSDCLR